jgi:hypothetical protein
MAISISDIADSVLLTGLRFGEPKRSVGNPTGGTSMGFAAPEHSKRA